MRAFEHTSSRASENIENEAVGAFITHHRSGSDHHYPIPLRYWRMEGTFLKCWDVLYSRRIAYRDTCYMNKQVLRILETANAVKQISRISQG